MRVHAVGNTLDSKVRSLHGNVIGPSGRHRERRPRLRYERAPRQNLVCRHLAGGWALGRFLAPRDSDGAPKHDYRSVAPGTVVDLAADEQTVAFLASRDSTVVDSARLGKHLRREFDSMQPGETRRLLLGSANHAMASRD